MLTATLLVLLKVAIASGAAAAAGAYIASKLPPIHIRTGHQQLDNALEALANAAESVVKAELGGPLLEELAQAIVGGNPLAGPLAAELPRLRDLALQAIGPAMKTALADLLESDDAVVRRAETEILASARDHAVAHANLILTLPSGRTLVRPA